MWKSLFAAIAIYALAGCASSGGGSVPLPLAGSAQAAVPHLTADQAALFSKQIEHDLAAKGARLAIVFRTGEPRDTLPEGISYTHGGFWAYVPISLDDGSIVKGYAIYNLYHGDGKSLATDKSYLHQDFPLDFAAASGVDDVGVIIPTPEMQRRILTIMDSSDYQKLHIVPYSLVSNPHDIKYQNCTEFMLDVIAAAAWGTTDMAQIKANLKAHFKPTVVKTSGFERFFAPIAHKEIKTDDQDGNIITATYDSLAVFMRENGLLQEAYVMQRAPDAVVAAAN
jgi:hypothetical protein